MGKEKDDKDLRTRDFVKEMEAYARQNGYSRDTALDQLIYVMTAFFTFGKTDGQLESIVLKHYNELFRLMRVFFFTLRNELEEHEWFDLFGDYFMEVAANVKGFGQCFTPDCVCDLMSRLLMPTEEAVSQEPQLVRGFGMKCPIYDCAAGSSRLLLAAGTKYRKETKKNDCYLMAADVDDRCVKMSALNMLFHGFYGEVVCMDTLMGNAGFRWGYIVNSGLYPIPFGLPSLEFYTDPRMFHQLIKSK